MSRVRNDVPSIAEVCRQNAHKSPDETAFEDAFRSATWGEFDRESRRAANAFSRYASRGDRIAFLCEASVDHAAALVGAMKAGCVVTNLHARSSSEMLRYSVRQIRPSVLVVDRQYRDRVEGDLRGEAMESVGALVTLDPTSEGEQSPEHGESRDASVDEYAREEFLADASEEEPDVLVEEDDPAFIWWTSGSTGRPKGWAHTHRSLYLKGMKSSARYGIDRRGTTLVAFSPSFGAWTNNIMKALLGCESVYFLRDWDPRRWLEVVESKGITHAGMVVTMWRDVLDEDPAEYDISSLSTAFSTGEKLDLPTLERIHEEICENVYQTYGSTEMFTAALYPEEMTEERLGSVGKPVTGTELRIIEPGESPEDELDAGEAGEIIVRGPDAPAWVWGDSEKTRESFRDGWWYSGDLGYKDEDGYLYFEGRANFVIKSKGVKVVPAPIEEVLNDHPRVDEAVVVGVEDEEYGERVTAIVVPDDPDLTAEELEETCLESETIADHERPRDYRFVDEIEKTASGKVDRRATRERLDL